MTTTKTFYRFGRLLRIPSIFFFLRRSFPFFCSDPSGFVFFSPFLFTIRALFVANYPQSPPKCPESPANYPKVRRRVPRRPKHLLCTPGLREGAWSPRSVRATALTIHTHERTPRRRSPDRTRTKRRERSARERSARERSARERSACERSARERSGCPNSP